MGSRSGLPTAEGGGGGGGEGKKRRGREMREIGRGLQS